MIPIHIFHNRYSITDKKENNKYTFLFMMATIVVNKENCMEKWKRLIAGEYIELNVL